MYQYSYSLREWRLFQQDASARVMLGLPASDEVLWTSWQDLFLRRTPSSVSRSSKHSLNPDLRHRMEKSHLLPNLLEMSENLLVICIASYVCVCVCILCYFILNKFIQPTWSFTILFRYLISCFYPQTFLSLHLQHHHLKCSWADGYSTQSFFAVHLVCFKMSASKSCWC